MSREKVEEQEEGGATAKHTLQFYKPYGGRQNPRRGGVHVGKILRSSLTVLESNSCLFCARTFSTPAWSVYVTNPKPLRRRIEEEKARKGLEKEPNQRKHKGPGEARRGRAPVTRLLLTSTAW